MDQREVTCNGGGNSTDFTSRMSNDDFSEHRFHVGEQFFADLDKCTAKPVLYGARE
jgi:hypothetical protein